MVRKDKSNIARKEEGLSCKANTVAGKEDGLSSEAKEQQNARWFNQALEESSTIHLVKEIMHDIFG